MARNILQSSLQNAGFSIVFQILCRIVTFGINAFIVRNVGREVLGIMNVRLLLLESTLLFLSREAINRASLSATSQHKNKCTWPQLINQMWLTVPICLILCIPSLYIWLNILTPVDEDIKSQYDYACYAVAISCIFELCAEAPVFLTQVFCFIKLKILINTIHILFRSTIFIWMVLDNRNIAIHAFGIAQVSSSFIIILGHYLYFYYYIKKFNYHKNQKSDEKDSNELYKNMDDFPFTSIAEMLPGGLKNDDKLFNSELQVLTLSFVKQGVLKQILTEGEKYVMSMSPVLSFSEQATYDVVNNLGSLAARFIFRPIEDSSYFYFTQTLSRDIKLDQQNRDKVLEAGKVLKILCMCVTSIGLIAFTYGQNYSHSVLLLYGGSDFVFGGLPEKLLQWHCLAICLMAVNGVTEGYMFATNTSNDINKYNYYMAIFSVCFLVLSYALTSFLGPIGFILANCANMFCRVVYSTFYIRKQYQPIGINPLIGVIPGKVFLLTLMAMGLLCKCSMSYFQTQMVNHLLVGAATGVLCILAWSFENKDLVKILLKKYGSKLKIN